MAEGWRRELFLNRSFEANSIRIGNVRLNSSIDDIDYLDIIDIYVDHKGYELLRFIDRLDLLRKGKGFVHLASGASFEIKKGVVKQIKLSTRYLQDNKTNRKEIVEIFGKPDIILVDDICYSGFDYNIDAKILVFRKKQIYAFLDPKTENLKELHFGEFDEKGIW